jgi:protein TonB
MSSVVRPLIAVPFGNLHQVAPAVPSARIRASGKPDPAELRLSPALVLIVLAVHAGLLVGVLNQRKPAPPVTLPQALTMRLITPEPAKPAPAKPRPLEKTAPQPHKPVIAPSPAPPVLAVAQAVAAPAPVKLVTPPPIAVAPAPSVVPLAAPTPPQPAPPAPVEEPKFNADYLDNPKPPYPSLSRRLNETGEVRLRVWVTAEGRAAKVELFRSSGYDRLDRVALETVQRWRFVPARQGNQAVAATVIVPISFNLRSE